MKYTSLIVLTLCYLTFVMGAQAQCLTPIKRFHPNDSPYTPYHDNFISGFMQSASQQTARNGFLQMPFVGDPLLVYVGEKDSTQFTAYASGYLFDKQEANLYSLRYTRYNITADIEAKPAYCIQHYVYPDTTAEKGFLIDVDNAMTGAANDDMDIVFIDKRTVRAYKRSTQKGNHEPALYYVAHFSHPFNKWNVRREVVRTENGQREKRCKAALMFDLKPGEVLMVQSAVSNISTDGAYAAIDNTHSKRHFDDHRKEVNKPSPLLTQHTTTASKKPQTNSYATTNAVKEVSTKSATTPNKLPVSYIEISTRNAQMQAAFTASLSQLLHLPNCKKATNAVELLDAIMPLYQIGTTKAEDDAAQTDSLLRHFAQSLFMGQQGILSDTQAAWFVFNAIGFVPYSDVTTPQAYKLVRPLFNVATLHLPRGRRTILHTKNNTAQRTHIEQATLMHQPLSNNLLFTREQLLKGGVLEVKMTQ